MFYFRENTVHGLLGRDVVLALLCLLTVAELRRRPEGAMAPLREETTTPLRKTATEHYTSTALARGVVFSSL